MSCHSPSTTTRAARQGVPLAERKFAGTTKSSEPEAPCAQCQADAVHAASGAPVGNTAPPPPSPSKPGGFEIGAPDDTYEREADRVAGQGMNRGRPAATQPIAPSTSGPKLQRLPAATPNAASAPAHVQQVLATPGMPLDTRTRSFFEPRFGRDFSNVRVHADDAADRSARAVDAQAYTIAHHVVFSRGKYAPAAEGGRRLLAHELAHVVQQSHSAGSVPALQRKKGKGKGPGSCGLLSAATATVLGGAAHVQIQTRLSSRGITPELEIPRATKTNGLSRRCQPLGTVAGFADVARVTAPLISVGEIKPYYIAKVTGPLEARHYRRRAEQSKQRLTRTGTCGKRSGPGPDDVGFQLRVGPISLATTSMLLSGAISGNENFGAFSQDPTVDLIAQEVGGGAIGYWCRQNAAGKKAEEEEKKKKKQKKKPKGKGGAANVGIGISVGGSSVGGANVGVGVSIDSNSAAVGTAGAGIAISSDSAAAGAAGVGSAQNSQSAAAGAAGAGTAKDSEGVAAGAAGAGSASGSTSAGAGVAGSGKSEDSVTAGAGTAGKGEVKDSVTAGAGGSGSGKVEGQMGAGKAGSPPKKPVDPQDVSGKDAEKTPDGDAEQGRSEGPKGGGDQDKGDKAGEAGGDKEAGGGGGTQSSGDKGTGSKGGKGSSDKASGDKGGTGTGGNAKPVPGPGPVPGSGKGTGAASNPLGVYTVIPLGTSDAERERIAAEAAKVSVLVHKASEAQKDLLRHLSGTSPDKRYMVPTSQWVEKMMNVTKGLSVEEIQFLKQLNWTPGDMSEAELRKRIEKLLAIKPKTPPKGEGGSIKAPDQPGDGGGKGGGKGTGEGSAVKKPGASGGTQADDDKTKKPAAKEPADATDRVSDPPKGAKRDVAGDFIFLIFSGITADSDLKEGTPVVCRIRVHDIKTERTFELDGVSITFLKRTLTPVTLEGTKFNLVKTKLHITKDFWSDKYKFYGRGGPGETIEYDFGRRKAKK